MSEKRSNPLFEQQKRLAQQDELVKMAMPEMKTEQKRSRKVSMNITLPQAYKEKLQKYSVEKQLSASILIQMWIDEHCV